MKKILKESFVGDLTVKMRWISLIYFLGLGIRIGVYVALCDNIIDIKLATLVGIAFIAGIIMFCFMSSFRQYYGIWEYFDKFFIYFCRGLLYVLTGFVSTFLWIMASILTCHYLGFL